MITSRLHGKDYEQALEIIQCLKEGRGVVHYCIGRTSNVLDLVEELCPPDLEYDHKIEEENNFLLFGNTKHFHFLIPKFRSL